MKSDLEERASASRPLLDAGNSTTAHDATATQQVCAGSSSFDRCGAGE